MTVVFFVGCRADKADGPCFQIRLQHVRCVHRSLAGGSSAHQCVYLIDVDDILIALFLDAVHDLFDAVLEVTTILRTRQQRPDIELVDTTTFQALRHASLFNHPCQSPDKGRLAHPRFTHMQWIILVATAQHLNRALQLLLTTYQGIMVLVKFVHAGY